MVSAAELLLMDSCKLASSASSSLALLALVCFAFSELEPLPVASNALDPSPTLSRLLTVPSSIPSGLVPL